MRLRDGCLVIAFLLIFCSISFAQINMAFNFEEGDLFSYDYFMVGKTSMKFSPPLQGFGDMDISLNGEIGVDMEVEKVDEEGAWVSFRMTRIYGEATSSRFNGVLILSPDSQKLWANGKMYFDSESGKAIPLNGIPIFESLAKYKITSSGKLLDIQPGPLMAAGMQNVNDAAFKEALRQQSRDILPVKGVSPGDSWEFDPFTAMPEMAEGVQALFKVMVDSITVIDDQTFADLKMNYDVSMSNWSVPGMPAGAVAPKIDVMKYSGSGDARFNATLGQLTDMSYLLNMEMAMSELASMSSAQTNIPNSFQMDMTFHVVMKLR
jgi:hypothetical protein